MATFTGLPMEMRELILKKLRSRDLLQCRLVCQEWQHLVSHLLNCRHQLVWRWRSTFSHSDDDDWVHSKMVDGVLAGGLPACCRRHNFERIKFSKLMTKSLVIWIEDANMRTKIHCVVKPLLLKHGLFITSFTLTLEECHLHCVDMGDVSTLLTHTPHLKHFGFKVCNCSVRPWSKYRTRYSHFPSLPNLEVLDLEFNENIMVADALLQAYGNQLKRLVVQSGLLEGSTYLQNMRTNPQTGFFGELRDLKINRVNGIFEPRFGDTTVRRKYSGRRLFTKLCNLPTWRLERLSLNIDDWAIHRQDRWTVATLELFQLIAKFSPFLQEFYLSLDNVDRSFDIQDWHSPVLYQHDALNPFFPVACPNLKKVSVDSILMETPLLLNWLKGLGHVEEVNFLMWCRYDARWSSRYLLANISGNARPTVRDLPKMMGIVWKGLPTLKKITVFGTNDSPPICLLTRVSSTRK